MVAIDLSTTNIALGLAASTLSLAACLAVTLYCRQGVNLVPGNWQVLNETLHQSLLSTFSGTVRKRNCQFFPLVFTTSSFVLLLNVGGLVPFNAAISAHLIVALGVASAVCLGVIAASCNNHGMEALNLFMPSEAPLPLAAILVPIETFAVFFKPVALGVRLFANTTAGLVLFRWQ